MKKFTDQERAAIARGWAASGLPQDQYAASYGVTGRCLRAWQKRYAPPQPPIQRVEAILVEMMAKLQAVLDDVREQEDRAEVGIEHEAVVERANAVLDERYQQEGQAERSVERTASEMPTSDSAGAGGRVPPVERAAPRANAPAERRTRGAFFQDFR